MMADSFMRPMMANLQRQTDVELVCEGTPSFLLMLDSMLASSPRDKKLLLTATQAFTGYAAALDSCGRPERAAAVSTKAKVYGMSLLWDCDHLRTICNQPFSDLQKTLTGLNKDDVDRLFWAGNGWATWIRHQEGSPESMAEMIRVEQIMLRVLELDESFYYGGAHIFLGAYYGSKPPLLGGKPEESRYHFEQALDLGKRQFLPALVLYAQTYARQAFDRELFVDLLQEVISFPVEDRQDILLANQVAKINASRLLEQVDQFF